MGLLTGLLGLPLAPLRGTVAVAEQVRRQAEEELYDPARIREALDRVDRMRAEGGLTDEQADHWEDVLVERLIAGRTRGQEE